MSQRLEVLILCIAAVFVVLGSHTPYLGDTANSRLATVLSLAKYRTFYLDRPPDEPPNPFEQRTIDKVMVNGRLISSKPPMLSLLMAGEYLGLKAAFGWDLEAERHVMPVVRFMTLTLVGFAYLLTLVFFRNMLRMFVACPIGRVVSLFGLAFCTQLWGFSTSLNNHVPAACMLVLALYLALGLGASRLPPTPWRFVAFGLAAGLVPTLDMPSAIFILPAGLYLLARFPKQTLLWTLPGAAVPLAIHFGVMTAVTGSPLPVQLRKELYLFENSYWRHPLGIDALHEPKPLYLFHITFGRCGLFSLYPVFLLGMVAALRAAFRKDAVMRRHILTAGLAFAVLTAYYVLFTNNYGGEAYGFRWYITSMPILLFMGATVLPLARTRWQWVIVALWIAISFFSAWECTQTPWAANREWTSRLLSS